MVSWFVYVVRLAPEYTRRDRDRVIGRLREQGVAASDYFRPIHLQPSYRRQFEFGRGDFPVAEAVGDRTIALPFHTRLRSQVIRQVVKTLRRALSGNG